MSDSTSRHSREKAAALIYDGIETLPRIVASGQGELARRIIDLAQQHAIPLHEDSELAELLQTMQPGSTIPQEAFLVVAEVLCFLYHTDREWAAKHSDLKPIVQPEE